MAGCKTILALLLLLALLGASPVFAALDGNLILAPTSGCAGTEVTLTYGVADYLLPVAFAVPNVGDITISSDPGGLISQHEMCTQTSTATLPFLTSAFVLTTCFVVSQSACGSYAVVLSLDGQEVDRVMFEVPSTCSSCAAVGGYVQPATFGLIAPWVLAIGLVGVATVVVELRLWKRRR